MTPTTPLLSQQDARLLLKCLQERGGSRMLLDGLALREPLQAIADGRAVVVEAQSETTARHNFVLGDPPKT